jgi:hypothetical protein
MALSAKCSVCGKDFEQTNPGDGLVFFVLRDQPNPATQWELPRTFACYTCIPNLKTALLALLPKA